MDQTDAVLSRSVQVVVARDSETDSRVDEGVGDLVLPRGEGDVQLAAFAVVGVRGAGLEVLGAILILTALPRQPVNATAP